MNKLFKNLYKYLDLTCEQLNSKYRYTIYIPVVSNSRLVLRYTTESNLFDLKSLPTMEYQTQHSLNTKLFSVDYIIYNKTLYIIRLRKINETYKNELIDETFNSLQKCMKHNTIRTEKLIFINELFNNNLYTNMVSVDAKHYIENYLKKEILPKTHKTDDEIKQGVQYAIYKKFKVRIY